MQQGTCIVWHPLLNVYKILQCILHAYVGMYIVDVLTLFEFQIATVGFYNDLETYCS